MSRMALLVEVANCCTCLVIVLIVDEFVSSLRQV